FAEMFGDLKQAIEEVKTLVYNSGAGNTLKQYRDTMLQYTSDIEVILREMREKHLKVAIMALKKSGKSVVVNCLLGDDYAPASIELPTFTTCIYRKSRGNRISLNYKDRKMFFDNPETLRKYVLNEFRNMNIDKKMDHITDAMDIGYLPKKNSACDYTIIDTPGPDLAGSYHKELAYKWIREADVILFIIDYTKHLASSEEEFFSDIKKVFEEHKKFYSFIVVVNKLDLMYLSEEKKSSLRFIDFLRSKLKDMGYRGFIVFGVSALQYFNSIKASQIEGCGNLDTDDGKKLRTYLDKCLVRYQGKDEMTVLSFFDNQIRNLLWFHGKEDATLKDLKEKSGVEQLMNYINYIAMEKAHIEIFNHKMSLADKKLKKLLDDFINNTGSRLEKDKNELEELRQDITQFSGKVLTATKQDFDIKDIHEKIERDLNLAQKSLSKALAMQMENIEKQLTKSLRLLSKEELLSFQKGNNLKAIDAVFYRVEKSAIEKLYVPVLGKHLNNLNKRLADIENKLEESRKIIQEKILELNVYLKKDYSLNCSEIMLPKLPDSFTRFDLPSIIIWPDKLFAQSLIKDRLVRRRGFWGALLRILSFGLINTRTGGFSFDDIKLKKALFILRKNLDAETKKQVEEMHRQLSLHIIQHLRDFENAMIKTTGIFSDHCKNIFDNFTHDLGISRDEIESKIGFLQKTGQGLEPFNLLWNKLWITE
ncbi:MAG: dynamin family protein, partial [Nitrospirae bacterium]|nr:dynamin family protein [Nitrospirota bacterium]